MLFEPRDVAPLATDSPQHNHLYVEVAIEQAVDRALDYVVPQALVREIAQGQRVKVPLGRGNKLVFGFVTKVKSATSFDPKKVKPIEQIVDPRELVTGPLMEMALWLSRYYFSPLGIVLDAMVPSGVKKRTGLSRVRYVKPVLSHEKLTELLAQIKAPRRRAVVARLLELEPGESIELTKLAQDSNASPTVIKKLAEVGVVEIELRKELLLHVGNENANLKTSTDTTTTVATPLTPTLTPEQAAAMDRLLPLVDGGFSVTLVRGVTGSGKTELYLRAISRVLEHGKGAIVMVPEIALTPQTMKRFTQRFGDEVAVMHSGLGAASRHRMWGQIASGARRIVVGARSAIFAPVRDLGIIVVDEEHESSYKQDSAPRYHGRDVAIKRAQVQGIPIILGSATPSLEMWHRTASDTRGIYHLIELNQRVANRPMPEVELIDLKAANKVRGGMHLFSPRLEQCLKHTVDRGEQAILLLNRRGYSNFIFCGSCNEPVHCRYCDTTMTYHRELSVPVEARTTAAMADAGSRAGQMQCHYCMTTQPLPATCPKCGKKLSLFGLGTQRVEEEMTRKFPGVVFARVDSDVMKGAMDYETLLSRFASGELQVLMGTQMLAKGLDFPNVTLVGIINGDTALALPDFRAAERTFQLLTQVSGRAGRADKPGRVVLQTFLPDDPTIRSSMTHDYLAFAKGELEHRKQVGLPPFSRQARIVVRDTIPEKLTMRIETLAADLRSQIESTALPVRMTRPAPCAIGRIAGYWRQQVVLTSEKLGAIQEVLTRARRMSKLISNDRVAVDVDPVSLL